MTREIKFTQGPWVIEGVRVRAGKFIIRQHWKGSADNSELCGNATLIAAAPDMYAALKNIRAELGFAEWGTPDDAAALLDRLIEKYCPALTTVIDKAEGRV